MNAEPRAVDVPVLETRIVAIDEPGWCVDPHDVAQRFTDLTHNGPKTSARIQTGQGPAHALRAWISHAPYLVSGAEPHPVVSIELDGGSTDFTPEQVPAVTAILRARLDELDELAAQALQLRGGAE